MSGLLSIAATGAGIVGAVSGLLGLGNSKITLGSATLQDFALPAKITWGGSQRLIRHVAPGGKVTISSLGPDWQPFSWGGILEGPSAVPTAKNLYAMMLAAKVIPLAWASQLWLVVIQSFSADDVQSGWVPYRITCAVSADPSQIAGPPAPTLSDQVLGDISSALGFNVVDAANTAMTALTKVQQVAGVATALTNGSAAFTALTSAVGVAQGAIGGGISLAETGLNALPSVVSGANAALSWVTAAGTQVGNLANAVAANGLIGRVSTNLANAST